jgi:hypothetical protein
VDEAKTPKERGEEMKKNLNDLKVFRKHNYTALTHLILAVVTLYDRWKGERDRKEREECDGPGAGKWESHTRKYRPQLCEYIAKEWSNIVKREVSDFPFHDDFVVLVWVDYRKEKEKDKQDIRDALHGVGKVSPKKWGEPGNFFE